MKAMILAAGRGERMRPLTDHTPKPLLEAGGKPLIAWHIERLVAAGFPEIVINCAWLAERLQAALGDGRQYGARIRWSVENPALETAGGIARALPFLGPAPFLVVNGDVWCDWDFSLAREKAAVIQESSAQAWLMLVDNPPHNPAGDFVVDGNGHVRDSLHVSHQDGPSAGSDAPAPTLTFSGIGVYEPALFRGITGQEPAALAPLLRRAMHADAVLGDHYRGHWMDIGTPQRLQHLDTHLRQERLAP